ncbi:DUF5677 domain-containing protein [Serratia fonticola]|uniref:DUF5677 domain-containing protein n=1 Tax=Serratia fonticola TaxID=47917 RepID=A0AAE7ELK4_SERFO|nr:DUF5677 domain-containing protein [Serratia fonticola]QKJ61139.1 DUF5677 domain-containing protein [Serratia fonticola]
MYYDVLSAKQGWNFEGTMHNLVKEFIRKRTLAENMELNEPLHDGVYYLEKLNELIERFCRDNEAKLVNEVPWPSMHDMYRRNYEYCSGVFGLFLIGQFPSCEALCRTAIEGSVNLHYISIGDSMTKQISYIKHHLETERKQNKNWKRSIEDSSYPDDAKAYHLQRISDKDRCLDHYEYGLKTSLALSNVEFDAVDSKWPSIFDRFKEIKDEVGYRTIYAALCSQAHNDAEDSLNKIMARITENVSGMEEAQWIEQYNFSLYMALIALDYHAFASAMYIAKFGINADEIIKLKNRVAESILNVVENGPRLILENIRFESA